jgi:hypothetical protein
VAEGWATASGEVTNNIATTAASDTRIIVFTCSCGYRSDSFGN